jgi:hypothetical protein
MKEKKSILVKIFGFLSLPIVNVVEIRVGGDLGEIGVAGGP